MKLELISEVNDYNQWIRTVIEEAGVNSLEELLEAISLSQPEEQKTAGVLRDVDFKHRIGQNFGKNIPAGLTPSASIGIEGQPVAGDLIQSANGQQLQVVKDAGQELIVRDLRTGKEEPWVKGMLVGPNAKYTVQQKVGNKQVFKPV